MRNALRLVLVVLLAAACGVRAGTFTGEVSHVTDGDSLWVRPANGSVPVRVRLQGLDAPERCQRFGAQAREALAARVLHQRVTVRTRARDGYDRLLARVSLRGDDVNAWVVRQGWAWSARWHGRPTAYAAEEQAARRERRGLWADPRPTEPREFRRQHGPCDH